MLSSGLVCPLGDTKTYNLCQIILHFSNYLFLSFFSCCRFQTNFALEKTATKGKIQRSQPSVVGRSLCFRADGFLAKPTAPDLKLLFLLFVF